MEPHIIILMFFLLMSKHFVVDFPLQVFPYQYENKGTYGHPGGILHAGLHTIGSLVALIPLIGYSGFLLFVCICEGIAHYHIDWAKMNINKKFDWKCNTSHEFWLSVGVDQYAHNVTYVLMVIVLM